LDNHTNAGFAASTYYPVFLHVRIGVMWTVVNGVERRAFAFEPFDKLRVDLVNAIFIEPPARDHRLVRDNDGQQSHLIDRRNCFGSTG
jgi:hypothetical protein